MMSENGLKPFWYGYENVLSRKIIFESLFLYRINEKTCSKSENNITFQLTHYPNDTQKQGNTVMWYKPNMSKSDKTSFLDRFEKKSGKT